MDHELPMPVVVERFDGARMCLSVCLDSPLALTEGWTFPRLTMQQDADGGVRLAPERECTAADCIRMGACMRPRHCERHK